MCVNIFKNERDVCVDIERKTEKYFSISGCHELAISVVINVPEAMLTGMFCTQKHIYRKLFSNISF